MSLFKRAAVRGMAHELVRRNIITFPSKQAMDEAADAVADASPMPEMAPPEGEHSPEQVAEIAQKLIDIGHALMAQAGIGPHPGAPAGAPPLPMEGAPPEAEEAAKKAAYLMKEAAFTAIDDLASQAAVAVMEKSAAETKTANPKGALMHGGDAQNTASEAAKNDSVAALDQKQRPAGAHHLGVGNTELETAKGELGHQGKATVTPSNSPSGTNSVIQASKLSEEDLYLALFDKCAADVGPYLPPAFTDEQKVAAIKDMIGLDRAGRQAYITSAYEKVASLGNEEKKQDHDTYKRDPKHTDEIGGPQKKESALIERVRQIAAAPAT